MKIVFLVIDALPNDLVGDEWTPNLWEMVKNGGWNSKGGKAVLFRAMPLCRVSMPEGWSDGALVYRWPALHSHSMSPVSLRPRSASPCRPCGRPPALAVAPRTPPADLWHSRCPSPLPGVTPHSSLSFKRSITGP